MSLTVPFTHPATTEIYTLSLHDALPIYEDVVGLGERDHALEEIQLHAFRSRVRRKADHQHLGLGNQLADREMRGAGLDRKSTRLNSSHSSISYAVFCLKKKKKIK